jgi:hypothetical protein
MLKDKKMIPLITPLDLLSILCIICDLGTLSQRAKPWNVAPESA